MQKKEFSKVAIAAVCLVAVCFGSWKAYTSTNKIGSDLLLKENIEAVGQNGEVSITLKKCFMSEDEDGFAWGRICPEGTSRNVVYKCESPSKRVYPYSATSFCYE